jgi:hypothetical protein
VGPAIEDEDEHDDEEDFRDSTPYVVTYIEQ